MGAFIARQPNGLLCRHSSIVDCVTHYNMTDEEYIELCVEKAKERAVEEAKQVLKNHIQPFEQITNCFREGNMTQEEFDRILREMTIPKEEVEHGVIVD